MADTSGAPLVSGDSGVVELLDGTRTPYRPMLALTRALIAAALRRNVRVVTAVVLPENARMLNLLRDLKLPERLGYEDGVELVEVELLPENPGYQDEGQKRRKR